ncbi:SEFIR domain-containing protein [Nocardia niigatensis]
MQRDDHSGVHIGGDVTMTGSALAGRNARVANTAPGGPANAPSPGPAAVRGAPDASGEPVAVRLLLSEVGGRDAPSPPHRIALGTLRIRDCRVYPVTPRPEYFSGRDAYLAGITYDLLLEPGVPGPVWFEIDIELSVPGTEGRVVVVDAIPGCVLTPQPPRSYAPDRYLTFAPGDGVQLPATDPMVDLFGVGGSEVRWRHTAATASGLRPGSYTSWMTVTVPAGCAELTLDAGARFDLAAGSGPARAYDPASEPVRIRLALPDSASAIAQSLQSTGPRAADRPPRAPRVFVSYAHDDRAHTDSVLRFSEFLAIRCGLDVHLDRWELEYRRNWFHWAIGQITAADFVLVIASPDCRRAADGQADSRTNRGLQSEMSVMMDRLHSDRETWLGRLLPVVLPGRSIEEIPLFLQPGIADHYIVSDFTVQGAEDLLRVITTQPYYERPQPNPSVVRLPTWNAGQ